MENRTIKFIYWFAYYNLNSPSVRYRAKYPLDFFKQSLNIESYLIIPSYSLNKIWCFINAYTSALLFRKANSLIVIQRVHSNFIYSNLLKLLVRIRKRRTVYDIDDADYLAINPKTIYFFARKCEKVSAGSQAIANHLGQFNNNVSLVTSPIVNLNIWKKQKNIILTIGWIGTFGRGHRNSIINQVFPAIMKLNFKIRLIILGVQYKSDIDFIKNFFKGYSNIQVEIPHQIDWNDELSIQKKIVEFDLGIATLQNNPAQISKSGIKAKQYLNNGVPVLSTDLPENNRFIVDGVNGYLCSNSNDFFERFKQFHKMSEKEYFQFSYNARESIKNFDHRKYFDDLTE